MGTYGQPEVDVEGWDVIKDLKSAVVMVHIFRQNDGPINFAYPPVSFGDDFNSERIMKESARNFVAVWLVGIVIALCLVSYCILRLSKAYAVRIVEGQVRNDGIVMRELPTNSTFENHTETYE